MIITTRHQFNEYYQKGYTWIPMGLRKKISDFSPIPLLKKAKLESNYYFVFESGKVGRYTYLGYSPLLILQGKNGITYIEKENGEKDKIKMDSLKFLEEIVKDFHSPRIPDLPKFYGGAVGFLSYDMVRYFETISALAEDDLKVPDLYYMLLNKVWAYDHIGQELFYIEHINVEEVEDVDTIYNKKLEEINIKWRNWLDYNDQLQPSIILYDDESPLNIETSFTKETFEDAVKKIQEYISKGDVFQVNLSVRQSLNMNADGLDIYEHLRVINPSPYMGYIHYPDMELVSSSPELLIEIRNGYIQTRPIGGTRPRGKDELEDLHLMNELLSNEKENAEHVMLVDLERNDLGRVCKYGSVYVDEFMVIEKYSHVMHLVSNIKGEIDPSNTLYECIKATFPGGTITGAPKVRTMEIIEELEPVRRGIYTGSMGWINFHGDLELNILIRTLCIKEGKGHIQAGAGIVIDSIPEKEYYESLNKAKALWKAVKASEVGYYDPVYR
ncbi:anthranilate synthase component I family protein [Tepidibacillus marianensis]|uniref:anthranilate synthase component I family protein n=1 Tax=Tepidibacillus marianensis TaxID=3131995 RepID=UPI0030CD171F